MVTLGELKMINGLTAAVVRIYSDGFGSDFVDLKKPDGSTVTVGYFQALTAKAA